MWEAVYGVAVHTNGEVYASSDDGFVQVFSEDGTAVRRIGSKGNGNGQLEYPWAADFNNKRVQVFKEDGTFVKVFHCDRNESDVAVDNEGKIHVTISDQHHVQVFSPDGKTRLDTYNRVFSEDGTAVRRIGSKGNGNGQFDKPWGLLLVENKLYVSDYDLNRVQYFSATTGQYIGQFGSKGNGNGQFSSPRGMSTDGKGNILVADGNNKRVQVFKEDGTFVQVIQCDGTASDVAVDNEGKIHVTICHQNHVQVFSPDGKTHLDTYSGNNNKLHFPQGIAFDDDGYIFITGNSDTSCVLNPERNKVHSFSRLLDPSDITLDKYGHIYIADTNNNRIMKY
uniref:SMP-30/Gluconolactonase/LRE-like region domain-containing protein n=1 Tax=Amphimedon queenslandica TaxID=400682 RepID=A0A1X7UHB5_AMPQE